MNYIWALLSVFFLVMNSTVGNAQSYTKPTVRAITAFVRIDKSNYVQEIGSALAVLHAARREFEDRGYQVWTVRIVTEPLAQLLGDQSERDAFAFLAALADLSTKEEFMLNVGPAMVQDADDPKFMRLLPRIISLHPEIEASAIIAGEDGIHGNVIRESARLIKELSALTDHSRGNDQFAATALLGPYGPFFPGSYHSGAGRVLSVGFQGASVVQEVFARTHGDFDTSVTELTKQLALHAKVAESIGLKVCADNNWTFAGVDPTPAPLGHVSIGAAIESFTGARFGSSGTLAAAFAITTAVRGVPVKQVGFSGLMLPVLEDALLAQRWAEGTYNLDSLLAYSSVCGTGLVTVPLPGQVSTEQLEHILSDVASLAWKWKKPLMAKLMPVKGKQAGDKTEWDGNYLSNTTLRALP